MIVGIGTDLCDIRRIERSLDKFGARFIDRIFTQTEKDYCAPKSGKAAYFAKRFAAKEAIAKALSGPQTGHLKWTDVEVKNDASGRPTVRLYRAAVKRLKDLTPEGYQAHVHLSLTDEYPYAQAFAVVEAFKA